MRSILGLASACLWLSAASAADLAPRNLAVVGEIDEFVVDGNTVLDAGSIEEAVYPYLGPGKSGSDIDQARQALEKLYQDHGYQSVQVSVANETPVDGTIHFTVSELRVGRLRVVGAEYTLPSKIKQQAPSVAEGVVPNFNSLKNDIVALNDRPGTEVTPALRAGSRPGTVDVDLVVKDRLPISASAEVDNQQSLATTPLRTSGTVSYDNLWQRGHSLSFTYQTAPERTSDAKVYAASYLARFPSSPYSVLVNGLVSDSNVTSIGSTNVVGKGSVIGARVVVELPGDDDFSHSIQAGLDYKHFRNDTAFGTEGSTSHDVVPVTYVPFVASYSAGLRESTAVDTANLILQAALPRIGSSRDELDASRYKARGQELFLRAALERTQDLPAGFKVRAHLDGQVTDQPLISNDQFSLGGARSVRGYYESEALVDNGVSGTLELVSPSIPQAASDLIDAREIVNDLTLLAFVDGGTGYILAPLPQQKSQFRLASYGVSAAMQLFGHLRGSVALAVPFVATENTKADSKQILFRVATEY